MTRHTLSPRDSCKPRGERELDVRVGGGGDEEEGRRSVLIKAAPGRWTETTAIGSARFGSQARPMRVAGVECERRGPCTAHVVGQVPPPARWMTLAVPIWPPQPRALPPSPPPLLHLTPFASSLLFCLRSILGHTSRIIFRAYISPQQAGYIRANMKYNIYVHSAGVLRRW
jgi:hypothetical protein